MAQSGRSWQLLGAVLIIACSDGGLDVALRDELLARKQTDQAIRDTLVQFMQRGEIPDSTLRLRMEAIDSANTSWLKQVVAEYGWPGRSLVGPEGANAAYLIAQHAIHDPEFQAEALRLMEVAYRAGEMEGSQVAYLTDRVAVQAGRPQRYGSQFKIRDGVIVFDPIEDSATVDERRAALGLAPLAEYARQADSIFAPRVEPRLQWVVGSWSPVSNTFNVADTTQSTFVATSVAGGRGVYSVWSQGSDSSGYEAHALWGYDSRSRQVRVFEVNTLGVAETHVGGFNSDDVLVLERYCQMLWIEV